MTASLSPDLVTQVRTDVTELVGKSGDLFRAIANVAEQPSRETRQRRAFAVVRQTIAVRSIGELASRPGREREDLLLIATNSVEEREVVESLIALVRVPAVFRAFAHVLPFSFRSALSDALRERLERQRSAIREPVWPDVRASLADLFVAQGCIAQKIQTGKPASARQRDGSAVETAQPVGNVLDAISSRLRNKDASPLVVTGDPGAGKSSLAAMIAGEFAERWGFSAVLFRASVLAQEGPQLELLASDESVSKTVAEIAMSGDPLVLIDGLDELPNFSLTRVARQLRELIRRSVSDARFILFGRPAVGVAIAMSLPGELVELRLQPFNVKQARAWAERWQLSTGRRFDVGEFIDAAEANDTSNTQDLSDLARVPLTLFLLASMERTGSGLPKPKTARGRTAIFRRILDKTAPDTFTDGLSTDRDVLRAIAVSMRLVLPREARRVDVVEGVGAIAGHHAAEQVMRVSSQFPVTVDERNVVRFVHASMRDQLAAEHLAQRVTWLLNAIGEARSLHESQERALLAGWVESFGTFPIDSAVLSPLQHMLPDWREYKDERQHKGKRNRGETLRRLLAIVYRWLVDDQAAEAVLGVARRLAWRPRRVAAVALLNVFALARCAEAGGHGTGAWFAPEEVVSDSFATAWHIIAAEIDLPEQARDFVSRAVSLRGMHGGSLGRLLAAPFPIDGANLTGADLRGLHIRNATLFDLCLDEANLAGAQLENVSLSHASLLRVNASSARFTNVLLTGADLRHATLREALFVGCSLFGADLRGADLTGATFKNTVVRSARLEGALFDAKQFEDAPDDNDIPF